MNKLIGISGKRGAGKGTFCAMLEQLLPGAISRQFGYELKLAAAIITGEPIDTFLSQQGKSKNLPEFGITAGKFLQDMGTSMRDGVMDDIWIRSYFKGLPDAPYIINESMRFPNEMEAIRGRGGITIRIEGDPMKQQGDGTRDDTHPSEISLDNADFDIKIYNNGTIEQLGKVVIKVLSVIKHTPYLFPLTFYADDTRIN